MIRLLAALLALAAAAAPSRAADAPDPAAAPPAAADRFFLRTGAAGLFLDEGAVMRAAGATVPGATIRIDDHATAMAEIGLRLTPNVSLAFTGGLPPEIDIAGAGTAAPYGEIGSLLYGPTALTLQFQARDWGRVQPYVGLGPMFMLAFDASDGAMRGLEVDSAVGIVAQVGADIMLTDRFGLFVDAKKARLRTKASGALGGASVDADVRLDPFVVAGGVTFRF